MSEIWLPVTGHEGFYEVSNLGRVRSLDRVFIRADGRRQGRRGRVLAQGLSGARRNYPSVTLRFGERRNVHSLVCIAFHGPKPEGDYAVRHGTFPLVPGGSGEANGHTRLTWDQVEQMRAEFGDGASQAELARKYGVGKSQAHNIVRRKQWTKREEWTP